MFRPSFATPLSILLAFSCLVGSFPATAAEPSFIKGFSPTTNPIDTPPIIVLSRQGTKQALIDLIAKQQGMKGPLLLHLWSPTCQPCQKEMKELDAATPELEAKGMKVIALAQDPDGLISVPAFFVRYSIKNMDSYIDPSRAASMILKPEGLPVTYLVSQRGAIISEHLGSLDWAALYP